jgi:hypothetical protein
MAPVHSFLEMFSWGEIDERRNFVRKGRKSLTWFGATFLGFEYTSISKVILSLAMPQIELEVTFARIPIFIHLLALSKQLRPNSLEQAPTTVDFAVFSVLLNRNSPRQC